MVRPKNVASGESRLLPTSARGIETRAKLLDAARKTFLADGYAYTSSRSIASAAGVGYGSFYVYFNSKTDIFTEVAGEVMDILVEGWDAAHTPGTSLRQSVEAANRKWFQLYRENAPMITLIEEAVRVDPEFRTRYQASRLRATERSAKRLRALQDRNVIDHSVDATWLAHGLGALAERLTYISLLYEDTDPEQILDTLNELWWRAMGVSSDVLED